jgi:tRNA nucleotidyltransferase (CCA-adding enzyme)
MIGRPYRGDLTINSLFYNINLRCVEDFTGMGLADLQEGVVRTPLAPRTTFLDDPLRILVRRCRLNP